MPHRHRHRQQGQASVELVALLPLLAALAMLGWQVVVAGQALWLAGTAARGAARAQAVGGDAAAAGRAALPPALRPGTRVRTGRRGVEVTLDVPAVVGGMRLGTVVSRASFPRQGSR